MPDQISVKDQQIITPKAETAQVEELHRLLQKGNATLTSPDGLHQVELPHPLYDLLVRIITSIKNGESVAYLPDFKSLTTRQAANLLGMSRQFLVELLNKGEIAHYKVGTHRRVMLNDVVAYQRERDKRKHQALNEMARQAVELGVYDEP